MNERAKLIDKIKKVLARAQSSNPHEAASAAALAAKLMQEHALSETDVSAEVGDPGDIVTEVVVGSEGFMVSWRFALVFEVARAFFCEAVALRLRDKRRVRIIGRKTDADIAAMVFKHLAKEVERLAAKELTDPDVLFSMHLDDLRHFAGFGESPSDIIAENYKDNFSRGAVVAIAWRLKHEFEAFARSSEKALVLVEKRREEAKMFRGSKYGANLKELGADDARKQNVDEYAMSRGYVAGMDMHIPGKDDNAGDRQKKIGGEK
jgi:hypothetical protein